VSLIILKAIFSYSGLQTADILSGQPIFPKEEIVSQTNAFRASQGLSQLNENSALDAAASKKLTDMVNGQYFAHNSPAGVSPWKWIEDSQYNYLYAGENLAIGFLKAKDVVTAWIDSPSHRANLINSNYKEIGVAVAPAKIQGEEGILVVQMFASPLPVKTVATAKPKVKVSPRPAPTISVKPTPAAIAKTSPAPSDTPLISVKNIETKTGLATVQTAENSKTLNVPNASSRLTKAITIANSTLILYAFLVFLASLAFLVFKAASKELVIKTALNLSVLVLAVIVPVILSAHPAFIF